MSKPTKMHPYAFSNSVVLDRGEDTNCTVNLYGATITSWRYHNREQLFVTKCVLFDQKFAIRGGVAVVFPHYGPWLFGLNHGFARVVQWTVAQCPRYLPNGDVEAVFELNADEYTRSVWSFDFRIRYTIVLAEQELKMYFVVENTDRYHQMAFDLYVETYVKVPDVEQCEIFGLKDLQYVDHKTNVMKLERKESVRIKHTTDRYYFNAPDEVVITQVMSGHKMKLSKENMGMLVVFNSWKKNKLEFKLYDLEEYKIMLSVGSAMSKKFIELMPGEKLETAQVLRIVEKEDEEDEERERREFDPYS